MIDPFKYYNNRSSAPGPPTNVAATTSEYTQSTVTWIPPVNTGGVPIKLYYVYILRDIYGNYELYGGSTSTVLTVTNLTAGSPYTFRVVAINEDDYESVQSVPSNVAIPISSLNPKPIPPTNVNAILGSSSGTVDLSWPSSISPNVTSYNIYYVNNMYPVDIFCDISINVNTTIGNLNNGTAYAFRVSGVNNIGVGNKSVLSKYVTPISKPGAPTNVTVTAINNSKLIIGWLPPVNTGGSPILRYNIFISYGSSFTYYKTTTVTTYTTDQLTDGSAISFKVSAVNSVGEGEQSNASNVIRPSFSQFPGITPISAFSAALAAALGAILAGASLLLIIVIVSPAGIAETKGNLSSKPVASAAPITKVGIPQTFSEIEDVMNRNYISNNLISNNDRETTDINYNVLFSLENNTAVNVNYLTGETRVVAAFIEPLAGIVITDSTDTLIESFGTQKSSGKIIKLTYSTVYTRNLTRDIQEDVVSGLSLPVGITFNTEYLYVTQQGTGYIARITLSGGIVVNTDFEWSIYQFVTPTGIGISGNYIYVIDIGTGYIVQLKLEDGSIVNERFAVATNESFALTIFENNIYISNTGEGTIYQYPLPNVPGAPVLTGTAGNKQANLSWTVPEDGGSPITHYEIVGGIDPTFTTISIRQTSITTFAQITNLTNGITYYFKVKAVNGVDPLGGPYSNVVDVTPSEVICFLYGTKILTSNGYVEVQNLQRGTLVKTLKNGYVPINMISDREIYNSGDNQRIKDRLYICKNGVFEDLVITGGHSVLVNGFKAREKENVIRLFGEVMMTDGKYRLPACIDANMQPYTEEGVFTVYHLALECYDNNRNFGIFANGLLVESCSKNYLHVMMKNRKK
jgi:hypothetical protein